PRQCALRVSGPAVLYPANRYLLCLRGALRLVGDRSGARGVPPPGRPVRAAPEGGSAMRPSRRPGHLVSSAIEPPSPLLRRREMRMTRHRITIVLLVTLAGGARLAAQQRSVTLADALRLAEQVQPQVILAQTDVLNASAQRRTTWGAYLPTVTASSSASDFFSEGASRVDPVTGQLTG